MQIGEFVRYLGNGVYRSRLNCIPVRFGQAHRLTDEHAPFIKFESAPLFEQRLEPLPATVKPNLHILNCCIRYLCNFSVAEFSRSDKHSHCDS
jgi:hypothetical protein